MGRGAGEGAGAWFCGLLRPFPVPADDGRGGGCGRAWSAAGERPPGGVREALEEEWCAEEGAKTKCAHFCPQYGQ